MRKLPPPVLSSRRALRAAAPSPFDSSVHANFVSKLASPRRNSAGVFETSVGRSLLALRMLSSAFRIRRAVLPDVIRESVCAMR